MGIYKNILFSKVILSADLQAGWAKNSKLTFHDFYFHAFVDEMMNLVRSLANENRKRRKTWK